ncbi:MAG: filamentous hemagglutinin N-terminal domain-containing protein, partial [Burkholderiales bacterium]
MNKSYRLIWNELTQTWVAVAEIARARGKRAAAAVLLAASGLALAAPPAANQLPTGGQIVGGSAAGAIASSGSAMTVTQNTQRMIANWNSFNIGANASVQFVQPSASAIALNRVLGQDPTQILGSLSANGQVMLVNPAGIVFGQSSQVNVGALVASSLALSDANFTTGNYSFARAADGLAGSVMNQGRITTPTGGVVALIAPVVRNSGQIETPQGGTLLAAADQVTLDFTGDGLITYSMAAGAANALVDNSGSISAEGGIAVLSARSADAVTRSVVNNSGVVRASSLSAKGGRIVLEGDAITLTSGSTLEATGASGGGTVLVGGDWQGSGGLHQATTVTMEAGASIDASATQSGDGGKVVLWSDT